MADDLLARFAESLIQAHRRAADQLLVNELRRASANLTLEQRADMRERAERERRRRELAEQLRVREACDRHTAVVERQRSDVARAVVDLHGPADNVDECAGCPHHDDSDGNDRAADWPCDTFLLVESAEP